VVLHIATENDDLPDSLIQVSESNYYVALQNILACFHFRSCISHNPSRLLFLLIPLPLSFLLFATFAARPADIRIMIMYTCTHHMSQAKLSTSHSKSNFQCLLTSNFIQDQALCSLGVSCPTVQSLVVVLMWHRHDNTPRGLPEALPKNRLAGRCCSTANRCRR